MPLRNPFRRQQTQPSTLRERAAGLRNRLASAIRKPEPAPVAKPEGKAPGAVEEVAGVEFGAYDLDTPLKSPTDWANKLSPHAMAMHVADRTLRMTKPELIAFIRDAGERDAGTPEAMFQGLDTGQETLEGWSNLLGLARARYIVAASAACAERTPGAAVADSLEPSKLAEAKADAPTDLAAACDQAILDWHAIQPQSRAESWGDAQLGIALSAYNAVFRRAVSEPSRGLSDLQAKARLLLHDFQEHQGQQAGETDDERLMRVVLREVEGLTDKAAISEFRGIDFGPDTHIAELAAEFCRAYASNAEVERAYMVGEKTEQEWLPYHQAAVALMEKLEATQPKTLLGMALKSLGAIGEAGWNARADGSTEGMDPAERVGAQFQDALMANALAPISISGPDLVGLVNFQAATMGELHAVYDMANEVSAFAYALVSTGRGSAQNPRSYNDRLTPAGNLMLWVAEALSSVEDTAYNEIKRRKPTDHSEQETRLRVLAPLLIANGDKAETAAFARELLALVEA